jgi:RNA polymerase sigma factor (sigma-70 family)
MTMTLSRKYSQASTMEGQPSAEFEALFTEHWERLCRLLYNMLGDWAEAEDLALETFVQLHRRPPHANENPGGWLYRVASNLGLNALRARKRRWQYEQSAGMQAWENDQPGDPADEAERRIERSQVRRALSAMKPRSAQLLMLRHSGLSYTEIADALGIASSSVGALLARAEKEFERLYPED